MWACCLNAWNSFRTHIHTKKAFSCTSFDVCGVCSFDDASNHSQIYHSIFIKSKSHWNETIKFHDGREMPDHERIKQQHRKIKNKNILSCIVPLHVHNKKTIKTNNFSFLLTDPMLVINLNHAAKNVKKKNLVPTLHRMQRNAFSSRVVVVVGVVFNFSLEHFM